MTEKQTIEIEISNYEKETPELLTEFERLGLQELNSLALQYKNIPPGIYHVELNHVFSNKYNTIEGYRVFEKCSCLQRNTLKPLNGYYISKGIEKIRTYQKDLKVCHYCGAQYYKSDLEWCEKCRGSQYLEPKEYHLLKLTNVRKKYASANTPIPENILANIQAQQAETHKRLLEESIQNQFDDLEKKKKAIEKETAFFRKLYDAGYYDFNNVIYYAHTDTCCFGWRKPLSDNEKTRIQAVIKDWKYNIQFK